MIQVYVGEVRLVACEVSIDTTEEWQMLAPHYVLTYGDEVVAEGVPAIHEDTKCLVVEFAPEKQGVYKLVVDFQIAGEHIIRAHELTARLP